MANTIKLKRGSGSDPGASDLSVGEVAVRTDTGKLFTKKDDNSVTEIGVTGNAATATKLETARTIAGVSFDGSANISLNNNAITNGAGYITATLTNEQVQDIVGGMVTGNTETGITVTYQDGDGTLDFVVGTLNQDTTGNAATATALETARNIGGVSFDGTGNINLPGVNTSGNQDTTGNAATATALETARTIAGVSFDGSANISLNNNAITNGAGYITATLTEEQVEDFVGGMVTGNTETGITVTYQDSDGTLDFVVASQTDNNFTDTLKNKLDGIAASATNVTNNNQLTNGAGYITSADGGNAATLDGIDSTSFLRSDATDIKTAGHLTFNDSIKSKFGTGGDLEIFHNGTDNYIDAVNGNTRLRVNDGEDSIKCIANGAVELYYDNVKKFETDTDGINVTGAIDCTERIDIEGNNQALRIGASHNLQIVYTGSAAEIKNLDASTPIKIKVKDGNEDAIVCNANGSVDLYHNDTKMFETTSSGVQLAKNCQAPVSGLTDGGTITVDFSTATHFSVTLGGNRTFGDPNSTGSAVGSSGSIFITQDGTGSRTASFHSDYKFVGGTAPTLSTAANAVDRIDYVVKAANVVHCVISLDVK